VRQLTSADAQFLAAEDGCVHGHFSGLAIFDPSSAPGGRLTREAVRDLVAERIHLMPPFHWRLVPVPFELDHPYWVEVTELDLDRHVLETRLAAPGDDRQLAATVGELISRPLDRSRPLWEIHVIQGLAEGRVAIVTNVHHAASDGVSGGELFSILHDTESSGRAVPTADGWNCERVPGRAEMLARGIAGVPRQPVRFVRSLPRALPHLDQVPHIRSIPGVPRVAALARRAGRAMPGLSDGAFLETPHITPPRTRMSGRITGGRSVAFTSTSLNEVKTIKNHFGVTVNDVVMSVVAGGLRAWLSEIDDLPENPLAAFVPVSVRTPEQSQDYGNRIALMLARLATDEPDPVARLHSARDAMLSVKHRHRGVPATVLQDTNHFIPPIVLARAARVVARVASSHPREATGNLIMSNVPGPREPQYLAGARQLAHYPLSAIFHGMGLNVTVVSSGNKLDWGIVCDPGQIDDPWPLAAAIGRAQAELLAALPDERANPTQPVSILDRQMTEQPTHT
jgi:WS/DGAT/MGAT family acyltransferase